MQRRVGAAFEVVFAEPTALEPTADRRHVIGLTAVRGAGERQFGIAQAKGLGGTRFDERQRLNRLDRRAREHRLRRLAPRFDRRTMAIAHHGVDVVKAFDVRATRDLDAKNRVPATRGHALGVHQPAVVPPSICHVAPVTKRAWSEAR